jgi:hypothetical protein
MKNIISSKIPFSEEQKNLMYQVTSALNYFCEKLLKEPHVNSNQDISEKINGFIEEMKYVEALFKTKNPDY